MSDHDAAPRRGSHVSLNHVVRVLVVDDSAYVRKVVSTMLSRSPFLEVVATARDGRVHRLPLQLREAEAPAAADVQPGAARADAQQRAQRRAPERDLHGPQRAIHAGRRRPDCGRVLVPLEAP